MNNILFDRFTASFCLFLSFLSLFFPGSILAEDRVEQWTGQHTRIVWVQDQGRGSDTHGRGTDLMLYGYDSRDGRGARPLLAQKGNFFKPLVTPDGKQVVVSNRLARKIFLVDWDSGRIRELGSGVAVAVWQETVRKFFFKGKKVWVYCLVGEQAEDRYGTSQPLYRFPIDAPEKLELVWDKTRITWSNLQLSRDGSLIGGLFPWPHGGVIWSKTGKWQRFGRGCWTSLSPDNSKLLWIFDGPHRNLQIYDVVNNTNWQVNINGAPGVGGYEVYHPRWSNHPRYLVLTGPYKEGEGSNKISGGGKEVEIYLGRFDAGIRSVESWLKLTDNNKADFYPDLWVKGGEEVSLADISQAQELPTAKDQWPAASKDLVFVWEDRKAVNQLPEDGPAGFYQADVALRGKALFTRYLQFSGAGGWGDTGDAGSRIGQALSKTGEAAVEFFLIPARQAVGRVLGLGTHSGALLTFTQKGKEMRIASTAPVNREVSFRLPLDRDSALHLVANFTGREMELFINGTSAGSRPFPLDFTSSPIESLELGDREGRWQGILEGLAVYNHPLKGEEIDKHASYASKKNRARDVVPRLVLQGERQEVSAVPAPDAIGNYSRALVVNIYKVSEVRKGQYDRDRILVAEWAVLDRRIVLDYNRSSDTQNLIVEKFDDHPELEGERQIMDLFAPDLELYYRLPEK